MSDKVLVTIQPKKVANLLKTIVNSACEDGFTWYPEVGEMPSILDMNTAINILEKADSIEIQEGGCK